MKNKFIIIFLIILFFFSCFLFFNKEEEREVKKDIKEERELIFSRMNFFLTKEYKASINIPNYWEGNYRAKEQGNIFSIVYLKEGIESESVLSIEMKDRDGYKASENEKILFENEKYVYIIINNNNVLDDAFYKKMEEDVETVLKSFKVS